MNLSVEKNSIIPIYFQIIEQVKDSIQSGELDPHDMLPSEKEICQRLQISRMTVKQAMDSLVNEGLVYRKRGIGTFVAKPKIAQPLSKLTSFTNDMLKRGMKPGSHLIEMSLQEPSEEVRERMGLSAQEQVIYIKRLRTADGEPMAVEKAYLNYELCHEIMDAPMNHGSLYDMLRDVCGIQLVSAYETIEVGTCSTDESNLMKIGFDMPIFMLRRTTYDQKDRRVEYAESVYRSDRYKFEIELKL